MSTAGPESRPLPRERPAPTRPGARIRVATVRRRLRLATDALAVADLLLGMNWSVRSVGTGRSRAEEAADSAPAASGGRAGRDRGEGDPAP